MKINPNAVVFWGITTCSGYLITSTVEGAVAGLLVGLTISLVVAVFW